MRNERIVLIVIGILVVTATILPAQEEIKITTIVPSQTTVRGNRGAIGSTYQDMSDAAIGNNNLVVQGIVRGDGGLILPTVASQAAEDAMVKINGQIWLRTDIN